MAKVDDIDNLSPALPTSPRPLAQKLGTGFVPAIYHPERATEYLRFERFVRKTKISAQDALEYATRALWYRQTRAAAKLRKIEIISDPKYLGRAA